MEIIYENHRHFPWIDSTVPNDETRYAITRNICSLCVLCVEYLREFIALEERMHLGNRIFVITRFKYFTTRMGSINDRGPLLYFLPATELLGKSPS